MLLAKLRWSVGIIISEKIGGVRNGVMLFNTLKCFWHGELTYETKAGGASLNWFSRLPFPSGRNALMGSSHGELGSLVGILESESVLWKRLLKLLSRLC